MARILIIGGSLGGLMAANLMVRQGHEVTVLEKAATSLEGRGAGIVSHCALDRGLRNCGIEDHTALGIQVSGRTTLGPGNKVLGKVTMPQELTSWSRLYQLLRQALANAAPSALKCGVALQQVLDIGQPDQAQRLVEVDTTAGPMRADLVVAADGIRSTVRGQLWPTVQPEYAGYVAWRGVCEESCLSEQTRSLVFDQFAFGLPDGEQFLGYPVAGLNGQTTTGHRAWNFVWYRPAPAATVLRSLLTDDDGHEHPAGIAPYRVSWRHLAQVREAAARLLAPAFAEIVQKCPQPFLQPIYDVCSTDVVKGRVVLIGDAAFVARPHVGMGVTKALEDAQALAQATSGELTSLGLQGYARARTVAGRNTVLRSRWLGTYMQASAEGKPAGALRSPESVMRETAIDLELYATAYNAQEMPEIEKADTDRRLGAREASIH